MIQSIALVSCVFPQELGFLPHFLKILESFHGSMKACINIGVVSKPMNEVQQGDLLAPTLFSFYLKMVLLNGFEDCNVGIMTRYRIII